MTSNFPRADKRHSEGKNGHGRLFATVVLSARVRTAASAAGSSVRREWRTNTRGIQNPGSTCNSYSTVMVSAALCSSFSNSQVPFSSFRSPLIPLKSIRRGRV